MRAYISDKQRFKDIYKCKCGNYAEVDKDGKPYGEMVSEDVHYWRGKAFEMFNPLWKIKAQKQDIDREKARVAGLRWLAEQLGVSIKDCYISNMNIEMCKKVVQVCAPYVNKMRESRKCN